MHCIQLTALSTQSSESQAAGQQNQSQRAWTWQCCTHLKGDCASDTLLLPLPCSSLQRIIPMAGQQQKSIVQFGTMLLDWEGKSCITTQEVHIHARSRHFVPNKMTWSPTSSCMHARMHACTSTQFCESILAGTHALAEYACFGVKKEMQCSQKLF